MRYPIPLCYADQAFNTCVIEALSIPEMVKNFNRLCGATLMARVSPIEKMIDEATGKQHADIKAFAEFVHQYIYMALPDEAIDSLRATHGAPLPEPTPKQ